MRSRRVHSGNPAAYPIGNFKRIERNRHFTQVIEGARPYVTTRIEEIAEVVFDWDRIRDLGFGGSLNLLAMADGQVKGSVDLLARTGHYTADRTAAALAWQPVATLSFLLLLRGDPERVSFMNRAEPTADPVMEGA